MNDAEIFRFLQEITKSISRIEANQANHLSYLEAVNKNSKETKKELEDHVKDIRAHGAESRGIVWEQIGKIFSFIGVSVSIVYAIHKAIVFLKNGN